MTKSIKKDENIFLTLLVYYLGFSALYSVGQGYYDFKNYVLNPETYILVSFIIISYYVMLILFYVYSIYLLAKEKPNAVFSTKLLLILLVLVDIVQLLWINYIKLGYEYIYQIVGFTSFNIIFYIYLSKSDQINKKFPKSEIKNKLIPILFFILTILLSSFIWLIMFAVQYATNMGVIPL